MALTHTEHALDRELAGHLAHLAERGLLRDPPTISAVRGPRVTIDGREVLSFCGNDYLGLANDPRLAEAAATAMEAGGFGSGASRLIAGTREAHTTLEGAVAAFKGCEAALVFGTGYQANVGVISALVNQGDALFSDALNHASLIDGCRLSGAAVHVYPHADMGALSALLHGEQHARRKLIVTDGVFSMDGDLAPLPSLCGLAEAHDAWLMVDDAHGTGVVGRGGRGTAAHFELSHRVPVQVGTFSKALGGFGAFVAGSRTLRDYLVNTARSFIFSTAPPVAHAAAALAALEIVAHDPDRRDALTQRATGLRGGLRELGFDVPKGETPIIPVRVGKPERTMQLSAALFERGVFVQGIRPPTVPPGTSRLRVTAMATHTEADIAFALQAFADAGRALRLIR